MIHAAKYFMFVFTALLCVLTAKSEASACSPELSCIQFVGTQQFRDNTPANVPGFLFQPQRPVDDATPLAKIQKSQVKFYTDVDQDEVGFELEQVDAITYIVKPIGLEGGQTYYVEIPTLCTQRGAHRTTMQFRTIAAQPLPLSSETISMNVTSADYSRQSEPICGREVDSRVTAVAEAEFERDLGVWSNQIQWRAIVNGQPSIVYPVSTSLSASCERKPTLQRDLGQGVHTVSFEAILPGSALTWRSTEETVELDCSQARTGCNQTGSHASTSHPLLMWLMLCAGTLVGIRRKQASDDQST